MRYRRKQGDNNFSRIQFPGAIDRKWFAEIVAKNDLPHVARETGDYSFLSRSYVDSAARCGRTSGALFSRRASRSFLALRTFRSRSEEWLVKRRNRRLATSVYTAVQVEALNN